MTLTAQGTVYMSKAKPKTAIAADGTWSVTLSVVDRQGYLQSEAWKLIFAGNNARNWWAQEGHMAEPGDGLQITAEQLHPHAYGRGQHDAFAEIHGKVLACSIVSRARPREAAAS